MNKLLLVRGLVLVGIALCFGIPSATYKVGDFAHAGPGLFPLLVSSLVGLIGLTMIAQSRVDRTARSIGFGFKNIAIVLASLVGFAAIATYFKVIPAIVYLVFVATLAGSDYSVVRNLKICAVLIGVAYAFHAFLGLNLPLL